MLPAIKNVVFDMGKVLLEYRPEEYCRKTIGDEKAAKAVYENLFCGNEWVQIDSGTMTEAEGVALVQKRIPQYAEYVPPAMANWPAALSAMPGMLELLGRLKKKGYGLYLLSNTSLRFYEFSKNFEVFKLFDGKIVSASEKLMKPDQAIFRLLCERFQLVPKECMFIDDTQVNIDAAKVAGLSAHLFQGSEELNAFFRESGILP